MKMSYADEEEEYDAKYAYRHMPIDLSNNTSDSPVNRRTKRYPWQLKIYIPQEYQIIIEKAKEIARREGRSLSNLIMQLLRDYVRVHYPGNPQLPLTRFTEESKEGRRCSVEGCDEPAAYQVFLDHGRVIERLRLCEKHLADLKHGWLGDRRVDYKSLSWRRISKK